VAINGLEAAMAGKSEYVHRYGTASQTMSVRTVDNFATFFVPYLSPGMTLLDVGSGPGTITVGLAEKVKPGRVVGIDIGESEVAKATENAKAKRLANTRFEVMDATALKFKDGEFDAVFTCMTLEHIPDAAGVIREIARVLKPGGVAGLKGGLPSRIVVVPEPKGWRDIKEVYLAVWKAGGGHPEMGLEQLALLKQAGLRSLFIIG
jgi:ubiquinone/menaquinone biosynthesis C-methylase UbiE